MERKMKKLLKRIEERKKIEVADPKVKMSGNTAWVVYLSGNGNSQRVEEYWGKRTPAGIRARFREEINKGHNIKIVQFVGYKGARREVVDVMTGEKTVHPGDV